MSFKRKFSGLFIVVFCLIIAGAAFAQTNPRSKRSVVIPRVAKGPVLKGDMSDPVWSKGALLSNFTSLNKAQKTIQQTSVRALYDAKYLYLGVYSREANMAGLVARSRGRDGSVWKDDGIEVLVDPSSSQHMFYHFFMNPVGGYFSTKCAAKGGSSEEWHGDFRVRSARKSDGWTAEIAISFADLGFTPKQGLAWGINICRNRIAGTQELSAWNPSPWGFEKPDYFGQIVLGDNFGKCDGVKVLSWGDMGISDVSTPKSSVLCSVPNDSRKALSVSATLTKITNGKRDKAISNSIRVKPRKTAILEIPYTLIGSDGCQWVLEIKAKGVQTFKTTRNVPATSAPERVWKLTDPLYKELLSSNPPGDQQYGSIYWTHTYSPSSLPAFGKEFGIRYSNEEAVKEMSDAKLLTICATGQLKDEFFLRMLDKYNLKVLFYPDIFHWTAPDAPKVGSCSFMADPRSRDYYFNDMKSSLAKYHQYIWGIYSGDEVTWQVMHQAVTLYAEHKNDYPYIMEVNEQVKNKYGAGKYGIPESDRDTNPYRWIALRKWVMAYLTDWQKDVYEITKSVDPNIRVISYDTRAGHEPTSYDMMSPYFDIATQQLYPPTDPNRQQFGFTTKMVADLTGKPTWPCTHVEHYAYSVNLEEVRELMSEVVRSGGKSFHFWLCDQVGRESDHGAMMATKWSFPERWRAICEINTLNGKMNEVSIPTDPDLAILYSEDHYASFNETYGMTNEPEWAYTFFGPVSRTWFKFINDNMVNDGKIDLSMFKAVVIPAAKYERAKVGEGFAKYVADGGTLVIGDPESFTSDINGEPLTALRTHLIGSQVVAAKDQDTMTFTADCSIPEIRKMNLSISGKVFALNVGEQTEVMARFSDGSPAVIKNRAGKGNVIVFAANPFTQSNISEQPWKDFFKALSKGLGLKTDRDIWRFMFPPYKTVMQPEPKDVCLTGNYVRFWQDVPVYAHNAPVAGTYSYSTLPDAVADKSASKIAFTSGKLTDRKSAYTTLTAKLNPNDFVVTWKNTKPVDVTFDLLNTRDLTRLNLWYSGQLPNVKVLGSSDGKKWSVLANYPKQAYVPVDDVKAHEDVLDIALNLKDAKVRYVKLSLGNRDAGNPLTLAECEIWGSSAR